MRDSECTGVIVDTQLVREDQMLKKIARLSDFKGTVATHKVAAITVDTPFFTGEVEAACVDNSSFDLIICNIQGASGPN